MLQGALHEPGWQDAVLRLRRIGRGLGLVLPKEFVRLRRLRAGDAVRVEVLPVPRTEEVVGRLQRCGLGVDEWNAATNEGEARPRPGRRRRKR